MSPRTPELPKGMRPEPIQYLILWQIMADPTLTASTKAVATALLLKFRNRKTGQCNPSYQKIANVIAMSRDTVIDGSEGAECRWLSFDPWKQGRFRKKHQSI